MTDTHLTDEVVKGIAAASVHWPGNISATVRDVTLHMLTRHRTDAVAIKDTLKCIFDGIALGAARRPTGAARIAAESFAGVDEALVKFVQAARLALFKLACPNQRFVQEDLKPALRMLRTIEDDLLDVVEETADSNVREMQRAFLAVIAHARRTTTHTGSVASIAVRTMSDRFGDLLQGTSTGDSYTAWKVSERVLEATFGILEGGPVDMRQHSDGLSLRRQ